MHRVVGEVPFADAAVDAETARDLLRDMVLARTFDERAVALQRRGWMSGYPPFAGMEASQVGAAHAMAAADWLFPTYRSNAMQLARGVPMADILLFRRGHAEFASDHDVPTFPQAVPVATQLPHAVGAAMAADYRGAEHATVAYFGDGATSEGDCHEAMNFAGVFDAPVLFFCENNHWAISTPRQRQTAADTLAGRAEAYGFDGGQVDGMDPFAVYEFVGAALATVREGEPVMVESLAYRQGAHTTSDDPSRYRDDPDLPEWRTSDPIERAASYLREHDVIDDGFLTTARDEAAEAVDAAVETAEAAPDPDPDEIFASVYAEPTPRLRDQRAALRRRNAE